MPVRATRYDTLAAVRGWPARANGSGGRETPAPAADRPVSIEIEHVFGENTFGMAEMKARLPRPAFEALLATIEEGTPLEPGLADAVALAMKEWATEKGATHFTHWFQPLTGLTAEKHDAFLAPAAAGEAVAEFSGKDLIRGEPDASSLPSGGLRATFEARGYTAWDPTSPAFIIEAGGGAYLAIPSVFTSWTGEALDTKLPLLRSIAALDTQARRALAIFGIAEGPVRPTIGAEQEFFLIDQEFYYRRPDLLATGRSLIGAKPPRGQELEDHYFGRVPDRVLAFMMEVERELYRLGVPIKTRHNEVAPGQYEMAPVYEHANLAADHQQLIMMMLCRTAPRYGLVALLHEKPFAGVNGSGKHLNWSLCTPRRNLLDPGDDPRANLQFLFFLTAVLRAVERHQDLIRASVAYAGNDHRLGANEAPPAIVSVYLGAPLAEIYERIEDAGPAGPGRNGGLLGLGVPALPRLPQHAGDRNRTSAVAFTGDKFEFRAPGGSQSISFPTTVLNTIVAESVDELATALEAELASGLDLDRAMRALIAREYATFKRVIFDGDGYSSAWREEAARRGLLDVEDSLGAIRRLTSEKNVRLMERYGVLTRRELRSREEVLVDQYYKTINIEGETTADIARTMVLPAAIRYLSDLLAAADRAEAVMLRARGVRRAAEEVNTLIDELSAALDELVRRNVEAGGTDAHDRAEYMRTVIRPAMAGVRAVVDRLERIVPDDLWPLPRYREMLFVT